MNNTAGSPRLVPPTIDPSWCPSGNWAQIFSDYQEKYLKATTVQVPGFGSLDLTQLAQLAQDVAEQGSQIAALTKAERSGFFAPVTLNDVTTITFFEMPSTSYTIVLTPNDAGAAITTGDFGLTLVPGSRQLTQFQFRSHNMPSTFKVDWFIRQI
jgi:hypothetical protein